MIEKVILLIIPLIFLVLASITDVKSRRIDNRLLFIFLLVGIGITIYKNLLALNLTMITIIIIIGYFRVIPMGDLKLWIVLTLITDYKEGLIDISIGAVLLIIYALISKTSNFHYKLEDIVFMIKNKVLVMKNTKKYPFALFVLIGYIIYQTLLIANLIR